jgi:hypothetical protein
MDVGENARRCGRNTLKEQDEGAGASLAALLRLVLRAPLSLPEELPVEPHL